MQAVLLDAVPLGFVAPGRAFAPETPAELMDGDLEPALLLGRGEVPGGDEAREPAAQDRDFDTLRGTGHSQPSGGSPTGPVPGKCHWWSPCASPGHKGRSLRLANSWKAAKKAGMPIEKGEISRSPAIWG